MRVVLFSLLVLSIVAAASAQAEQDKPSLVDSIRALGKKSASGFAAVVNGAVKAAKEAVPNGPVTEDKGGNKDEKDKSHDWNYIKLGADWGDHFKMCNGPEQQSPIKLKSFKEEKPSTGKPLELNYKAAKNIKFHNNGHTWQASGDYGFVQLNGKRYNTVQFHLHWKSEHTVASDTPLEGEVHIVHQWDGVPKEERLPNGFNDLLVTGFFIRADAAGHPFFEGVDFVGGPKKANTSSETSFNVDASKLHQLNNKGYYTYPGSLTTPGCNPTVIWHVFSEILPISKAAYSAFKTTFSGSHFPQGNRRALQPRLETTIVETNTAIIGKSSLLVPQVPKDPKDPKDLKDPKDPKDPKEKDPKKL